MTSHQYTYNCILFYIFKIAYIQYPEDILDVSNMSAVRVMLLLPLNLIIARFLFCCRISVNIAYYYCQNQVYLQANH